MLEYTVTGVRYQMSAPTYEEKEVEAERFIKTLKKGQEVVLVAEPENPRDPKAIAVYINYERVGYISKEECEEVHPLLGEDKQCDAVVERTDNHVTFFISIPGAVENGGKIKQRPRILPESPLGEEVRMPYTKEESALQLKSKNLANADITKENAEKIIALAELYAPYVHLSICHEDNCWRAAIQKKLYRMQQNKKDLELSESQIERLSTAYEKIRKATADFHRSAEHWPEKVFVEHLARLRNDEKVNSHLYQKYCDAFLDKKDFSSAPKKKMHEEYSRLSSWLQNMKWSELRDPSLLDQMGLKVNYLTLSRYELYDLYAVLLIMEKLDTALNGAKKQTKAVKPEEENKLKGFAVVVTVPKKADTVVKMLHEFMAGKEKPKDIVMPIRAAMQAGIIRRPSWGEFCEEFVDKIKYIKKSSYNDYTNIYTPFYKGEDYNVLLRHFKELAE